MQRYNPAEIEEKWQKKWREENIYETPVSPDPQKKKYILDMFPYPSGSGLHVGHVEGYTGTDVISRYYRMRGFDVLHPMGWDAFGLPAENYAVKTGVHPRKTTQQNTANFKKQMQKTGLSYDWKGEISTADSKYYKWTQWLFLQFFKEGLVYQDEAEVNWCPGCQTVLANEQVLTRRSELGDRKSDVRVCERCGTAVTNKELEQWFFKITDYADELVEDLDKVDWPESTVTNQRNWIGRSEGTVIKFQISDDKIQKKIEVFTTRPDTIFGATYMVLAPEHELVGELLDEIENSTEVKDYVKEAKKKSELERQKESKEKTGVRLDGVTAVNPATKEEIPIFVADYVLMNYGTGAIMAVPAHDERDFEFAKEFDLPIKEVIKADGGQKGFYEGEGRLINSGEFNGMDSEEAKEAITSFVGGESKVIYKLRDWLISRQRYWGAPIPIVYDPEGKPHPVPEKHLPWLLPEDVEFKPTGVSPLEESDELKERTERIFGKGWTPETDTIDTFVDSSWYFLRFCDPHNDVRFAAEKLIKSWMPVDLYVGGAEHTVLHLMYARFFTKVLRDIGYLDFDEPFSTLRHQGTVLAEDGRDMSKRYNNVVSPTDVIEEVGADTLRTYELFMGPFEADKEWSTGGVKGVRRFLDRVWVSTKEILDNKASETDSEVKIKLHQTVQKVTEDIESLKFNTAIAAMMEFVNEVQDSKFEISKTDWGKFILILAPFAPFVTEELWQNDFASDESFISIHKQSWPKYDKSLIQQALVTVVVQINGKTRATIKLSADQADREEGVREQAEKEENVRRYLREREIKRVIFVPGRLINFVTV